MNLTFQEVIAAPRAAAFGGLTDFDALIAAFMPSGAQVTRLDGPGPVCVGSAWRAVVALHGLERVLTARLDSLLPQEGFSICGELEDLRADLDVALCPAGDGRTRAIVDLNLSPRGVAGRLLIQPLRLVRGQITEKLAMRLARYARHIEAAAT